MLIHERRVVATAALVALAVPLMVPGLDGVVAARPRYVESSVRVARGLTYTKILDRRGPNRIKVLKFNPASAMTLDVALARGRLPGRQKTSRIARRHGSVAAVNGTFGLAWGRPLGLFVEDGRIKASPLLGGNAFALANDESQAFVGRPNLQIEGSGDPVPTFSVRHWNPPAPAARGITGYSPAGGRYAHPPADACSARLFEVGSARWRENYDGLHRVLQVDKVRCAEEPLRRKGGFVVSAALGTKAAARISKMYLGQFIGLSWSVGWSRALDVIAGNPVLVSQGKNIGYDCDNYFCKANPRTGIGVTAKGRILLVTVDGRRPGWSVGMNLRQFGRLFVRLGAVTALNLDGGGSTTMVVKDKVVNRPSDPAGQRAVSSAILLLPRDDPGEISPLDYDSTSIAAAGAMSSQTLDDDEVFGDPAVVDPGSTGGLLEALSEDGLGREPVVLPDDLERYVKAFEGRARRGFGHSGDR